MPTGTKIKEIRKQKGLTQKQLGICVEWQIQQSEDMKTEMPILK